MAWEKKNLVTEKDGSDTWYCTICGFKQKVFMLGQGYTQCPKCKSEDIYGGWFTLKYIGKVRCYHCNYQLIKVPKEGHPNSKYFNLGRRGEVLLCCPKNCGEETGIKPGVKKRPILK